MRKNNKVKAWVSKAEQDFDGACILARKRKKPVPDLVCFHCGQAAEKFLKGYLVGENIPFPETHDLTSLEMLVSEKLPGIERVSDLLLLLNRFGVLTRYPGDETTIMDAKKALKAIKEVRKFFAPHLPGIPEL
ncbi:MAG: HEPN domain-containing protein [Deltaproteobacteria bacterium]|nr:HEPN domain-containing protein [Deltaproteobacteria bacterium]